MTLDKSQGIRFVLNADDFGLAPGIDAAILALLQRGRISGVSAMATAPWWEADGPRLAPFTATADIGSPTGTRTRTAAPGAGPPIGGVSTRARTMAFRVV